MTDPATLILYGLLLVLPIAALVARRIPARGVIGMALAWVVIFAIGFLVVRVLQPHFT